MASVAPALRTIMGQSETSARASADDLDGKISSALVWLARSFDHASDTDRDRWDFAIEVQELLALGLAASDLRWLV